MKKSVRFEMVDPNEEGALRKLWIKILMDKLCSCWR